MSHRPSRAATLSHVLVDVLGTSSIHMHFEPAVDSLGILLHLRPDLVFAFLTLRFRFVLPGG